MKKPTRFSVAMLISAAALSVAVSAPAVFAEEGHGGRHGARGGDDAVAAVTRGHDVDDNDVNDDHGVDAVVTTTAGAPAMVVNYNDAIDDND